MTTSYHPGRCFVVVLLVNISLLCGRTMSQTKSTVGDNVPSPSPQPSLSNLVTGSMKDRMLVIMQVPDEVTPKPLSLSDLLTEENKRLKKKIADLEKENAELKQKLNHP